jgi:hypothetical protein
MSGGQNGARRGHSAISVTEAEEAEPNNEQVRIATYNIRSGRSNRLEMALRAMRQMNVSL